MYNLLIFNSYEKNGFWLCTQCAGNVEQSEKSVACGAACGAGDKPAEEKPGACGAACGAGEK